MNLSDLAIDKNWTLFLDRDGVINRRIQGGYVAYWNEFEFLPGVLKALKILSPLFGRIFIVTNQQGIGKSMMTEGMLQEIHNRMLVEIQSHGGKIDGVYYCPALEEENSSNRKPAPGMAYKAKEDFPEIDLSHSIMIGDTESDVEFGIRAGMYAGLCTSQSFEIKNMKFQPHFIVNDLLSFALLLKKSL